MKYGKITQSQLDQILTIVSGSEISDHDYYNLMEDDTISMYVVHLSERNTNKIDLKIRQKTIRLDSEIGDTRFFLHDGKHLALFALILND